MHGRSDFHAHDYHNAFGRDDKQVEWANHPPRRWKSYLASTLSLRTPMLFRTSIKQISLVLLVLQNSTLIVTMHYSRVIPVADGCRYFPSTAVFLVEIIKLVVSLSIAFYDMSRVYPSKPTLQLFQPLFRSVFAGDSWKLMIPAMLYTLQNSVVYIAIGNLDAATFQVTYQLKILTTVLFSIVLLGKSISSRQWLALVLLTAGVAVIQTSGSILAGVSILTDMPSRLSTLLTAPNEVFGTLVETAHSLPLRQDKPLLDVLKMAGESPALHGELALIRPVMNASRGILAVLAASVISGITGVYFEKVIKDSSSTITIWTRNVQMSFYSLFPSLIIGVLWQDGKEISRSGFFTGYGPLVWATIFLQAFGGIMVAICIMYTNNIAKNFAASISIVFSCLASTLLFEIPLTTNFIIGTAIVLLSVYLYQSHDRFVNQLLLPISKDGSKRIMVKGSAPFR